VKSEELGGRRKGTVSRGSRVGRRLEIGKGMRAVRRLGRRE